jgi:hypothetical protein
LEHQVIESVLPHNLIVLTVASVVLAGIVQGALMVRRAFTNQRLLQERIAELCRRWWMTCTSATTRRWASWRKNDPPGA